MSEQYRIRLPGKPDILYTVEENVYDNEDRLFEVYVLKEGVYVHVASMSISIINKQMPALTSIYTEPEYRKKCYSTILLRILAEYLYSCAVHSFSLVDASENSDNEDKNFYATRGCGKLAKNLRSKEGMSTQEMYTRICNVEDVLRETTLKLKLPFQRSQISMREPLF